ncbi:MAG: phage integrase SAM-like domain-containing protein [Dyadobacter sp.]
MDKQSTINAQAIKDAYLGNHALQKSSHTVMELLKYHARIASYKLEPGTLKNYSATEQYLKAYIKFKYNKEDIFLTQLNYEFITELEYHIRYHPIKAHDQC